MTEARQAVTWLLDQEEPEARRVAVQQIVKVRGRDAAELLLRALGDDDWRVRKEAAYVAASLEPRDEIVAALVAALEERVNIGLRNAAVEALVAVGPDAVPAVISALATLDADGRKLAVEILGGVPDVRGAEALARSLLDDDPNVRVAAAEALGNASLAGEEARQRAVVALADVLSVSEMFLKLAALDSLSRLDAQLPWKVFEPYASDPVLRRYAIAAAATSREPAAIAALARATADSSGTIVREAVVALGEGLLAGAYDEEATTLARAALSEVPAAKSRVAGLAKNAEEGRVRAAALMVLGLARKDVSLLVEALGDDEVADRAERALSLYGPGAAPALLDALPEATHAQRAAILALLPDLASDHGPALLRALRGALEAEDPDVLAAAAKALGAVGEARDLGLAARYVRHDDARVVAAAANMLASLAGRHEAEARALLDGIDATADDAVVGCIIVGAVGAVQPVSEAELGFLQRALAHADAHTRRAAVEALVAIGGDRAADLVGFALADEEREVQLAAMRALGKMGRADPLMNLVATAGPRDPMLVIAALRALGDADPAKAFRAARPLVRSPDPAIACAAVEAIGRMTGGTRLTSVRPEDALFEALEHPDAEVVKVALSEIAPKPDARALARLGLCLDHDSWEVRRLVAELLGQDGSPGAMALLRARYEREKDPVVREALAAAVSVRPAALSGGLLSSPAGEPTTVSGVAALLDTAATLRPGEGRRGGSE
jgi:HEAT repeat protein